MKTLTNAQIITMINRCSAGSRDECENCPLGDECLYYFTGEECESVLESRDGSET